MKLSPLTSILMRIFAAGFFRMHSGILIFFSCTIICYCFFINTLGTVPIWAFTFWNLIITLSLVSSPLVMAFFCMTALIYAIKSWQYVIAQSVVKSNEFLYYSISSFEKKIQFKSWLYVQINIFLPLLIYALFAAVIGFNFGHYIIPSLILVYLFLLIIISAFIYVKLSNRLININDQTLIIKLTRKWNKPIFSLYTFFVFDKLKITYALTKLISWILIIGVFEVFSDIKNSSAIPYLVMLMIVTTHTLLIYYEFQFNEKYLFFSKNLPYSVLKLFLGAFINYLLLMSPEILWFINTFGVNSFGILLYGFSVLILFRSLLYWLGFNMKNYLIWVFLLFNVSFLAVLYKVSWILPLLFLPISYLVFCKNYLNKNIII